MLDLMPRVAAALASPARGDAAGLGVQIEYHGPVRLVGHGGTFPGFDAAAYTCPETARSAAILANTNTGLLRDQLRKALRPAG